MPRLDKSRKQTRDQDASQQRVQPNESRSKKRKSDQMNHLDDEDLDPTRKFQCLKPRTRDISYSILKSKWASLPPPAQQQVREILKAARRPIILAQRNEKRRAEAEAALDPLVKKLERRLPRMPFPPKTKDGHFDLDKLLERNRLLESQLTPATHTLDLLRASIEQEEAALRADRALLAKLEANAKAEERQQRQQATKIHPLLKQPHLSDGQRDDAKSINLTSPKFDNSTNLNTADPELEELLSQTFSHMESMRNNNLQITGLLQTLASTSATLDSL